MQFTHVCIVLLASLHPIWAIVENTQTLPTGGDVEIRVWSGPTVPKRGLPSACTTTSFPAIDYETQAHVNIASFDSIELTLPLAPVTKYSPLRLGAFSLLNVPQAYLDGTLSAGDLNCATSAPNALLGSRSNRSIWPRFSLFPTSQSAIQASSSSTTTSKAANFQLLGLTVKPLHSTPRYVTLLSQGWKIEGGRAIDNVGFSLTWLNEGYQRPFTINLSLWDNWRKNLSVVEMWAESEEGEDWEFCVDDLRFAVMGEGE